MSYLPGLRASLVEAAGRAAVAGRSAVAEQPVAAATPARPSGGRRLGDWLGEHLLHPTRRGAVVNLALVVASVAIGLTATGVFKRGETLGSVTPTRPTAGEGVAIPGTSRLLSIRTPDPAGGLPWGLRVTRTTRGLTCVSVGRVDYGTIGVLGIDGAFGDDDRFHPLSQNYFVNLGCDVTDATGHGFVNVGIRNIPASGLWGEHPESVGGCEPHPVTSPVTRRFLQRSRRARAAQGPILAQCPAADMREIYFGLLGPRAQSIRYLLPGGGEKSSPLLKGSGAYLIVLPMTAGAGNLMATGDTGGPGIAAGEITQVRYADGHVCTIPRASLRSSCPPVGFVAPHRTVPSARVLASPVSVRTVAAKSYCDQRTGDEIVACEGTPPPGFQHMEGQTQPFLLAHVSFVSHVAIKNSASYYNAEFEFARHAGCTEGGAGGPTNYDIHTGQRIRFDMLIPDACAARVHGTITYVPTSGPANSMPIIGLPGQGRSILVGRFSFRRP